MSLLDHPRAQELLADADVSADDVRSCQVRLQLFLQRYYPGMKPALTVLGAKRVRNPKAEADHVHPVTRRPPVVG